MTSNQSANGDGQTAGPQPRSNAASMERVATAGAGGLLTLAGLSRGGILGLVTTAIGSDLLYGAVKGRSMTLRALGINNDMRGQSAVVPHGQSAKTKHSVTIDRPRNELYAFWRGFDNLQSFMPYIDSVRKSDEKTSHWRMRFPTGSIEWDAEIYNEIDGELIAWRSLPGSDISNAGSVTFKDGPAGRGTEVSLVINYEPPGGNIGKLVAKLLPQEPGRLAYDTLHRFKQLEEAGEIATAEMRPGMMSSDAPRPGMDAEQQPSLVTNARTMEGDAR